MIRFGRDFRLIPIVLLATIALFGLKVSGLVFDGGYTLGERIDRHNEHGLTITTADSVPAYPKIVLAGESSAPAAPAPKQPWAQEMFNFNKPAADDVTGSVPESKPAGEALKTSDKAPAPTKVEAAGLSATIEPGHINSAGERAILESLQGRRKELDARSRDLDMRESLLKAAEKRVEAKVAELKDVEARVKSEMGTRDQQEEKRFKGIISMYENMKPKDAARILEEMDGELLLDMIERMKEQKISVILGLIEPAKAKKITQDLASRRPLPKGG